LDNPYNPLNIIVDPSLPPGTIKIRSGKETWTIINIETLETEEK
jgi:hypothetical protein